MRMGRAGVRFGESTAQANAKTEVDMATDTVTVITSAGIVGVAWARKAVQALVTQARSEKLAPRIEGSKTALERIGARDLGGTAGWIWEGTKRFVPCAVTA